MLNWTEEDVKFITNSLLTPCLAMLVKETVKLDESTKDLLSKSIDLVAQRIRELDYEHQRDKRFFLAYLGKLDRLYDVNKVYENFCEEYDKLNKHLLKVDGEEP